MGQRLEQTSHEIKYTNGKQADKIYSISYVIRELLIKTKLRYQKEPFQVARIQNTYTTTCLEKLEQQELLFNADRSQSALQFDILERQNYGNIKKISSSQGQWLGYEQAEHRGVFQDRENILYDIIILDICPYTVVQTHRLYSTMFAFLISIFNRTNHVTVEWNLKHNNKLKPLISQIRKMNALEVQCLFKSHQLVLSCKLVIQLQATVFVLLDPSISGDTFRL